MENSNEVFVWVIDFMRRCKAEEDANEGIVSIIASSLRDTLIVMICQLQYVMIGDRNVSNSIAMRQGEECSSILDTNRDKLHCLKSKIIGHLKRFIHYIYETIERLPASKAEDDMIKRTIISNDLLLWVSFILDSDQTGEDKEVSSGVACSADDFQVMEEEDDADLDMAQRMSRTCSNDESSGLKSDEQTSTSRDNDSPQPALVSEDELTRMYIEDMFGCHSKDGGGDGGDSEDGSLDSDQTEMAQRMSRTCSNDESSGLESDEQMSTSRDNDGGDSLCDTEDADNITDKTSDTQYEDCNVLDRDSRRQIARNRRKHHLNQIEDNEEDMIVDDNDETLDFKHINASCGVTPLYRSNDGMSKIPVSYAALYRYRGRELAWMPRYLYYACVRVETSDTGKCSKAIQFGEGLGIEKRYHQVLRFKQCTLRFTGSPPVLPEKMPEGEESDEGYRRKRRLWEEGE